MRLAETLAMAKAELSRKVETPKQTSLCLRSRTPYFHPDPGILTHVRRSSRRHRNVQRAILASSFSLLAPIFFFGKVNMKLLPSPNFDSTQIFPSYNSTIFLATVSPTPLPAKYREVGNVWNILKIFSKCFFSIPSPLSATLNFQNPSCSAQPIFIQP